MERWLDEGLPGYSPSSRIVLELTRARAREAHDAVHELEYQTDAMALELLSAESERLNRVRYSLMALILAFSLLAAGAVMLYLRHRSATERVAITEARLTDSLESVGQAVALFDGNDQLLLCHRRYRDLLQIQLSRDIGVVVLADVMRGALESSRVLSINDESDGLPQVYDRSRMRTETSFELQWNDGRFFQVSFVRGLSDEGQDSEIVRAIVALARSLGLAVVAEGVQTQAQLQILRARNVDTVQGNVVSGPLSGIDARVYLANPDNPVSVGIMQAGAGQLFVEKPVFPPRDQTAKSSHR